jgi:hypothetical protein
VNVLRTLPGVELVIEHGREQVVQSGPCPVRLQQAVFAEQQLPGHTLAVGVDHQGTHPLGGEAFGQRDGPGRLGDAALRG